MRAEELAQFNYEQCDADGGSFGYVGLFGMPACVIPFTGGGLQCSDSSECEGLCRIELGKGCIEPSVGAAVTGFCESNHQSFGCYMEIIGGRAQQGLCVD